MVRLGWCWIMVESIVIPHGFWKWFYLSFYIHPFFLALLQIFLWIRKLHTPLLFILSFVFKISTFVLTSTCRFFKCCFFPKKQTTTIIVPNQLLLMKTTYSGRSVANIISVMKIYKEEEEKEEVGYRVDLSSCGSNSPADMEYYSEEEEDDDHVVRSSCSTSSAEMVNDLFMASSPCSCSSLTAVENNDDDDGMMDGGDYMPAAAAAVVHDNSNSAATMDEDDDEHYGPQGKVKEEELEVIDPFYKEYLQRMKWFDVLNHDRLFAIKNIGRRRLLWKSLEKDFELVYVAQSCLSWEAIHHQFRKVMEAVTVSYSDSSHNNPQNRTIRLFHNSVVGRFQKFQILLERFLEDERSGGTRHSNYVHRKYSLQTLLLVPHLSGYVEDGRKLNEEGMKATEVLKVIEKCITTFWLYVKVDNKRLRWSRPVLEDPRDLDLLRVLTKSLRKKEIGLKEVEGKRKCWLRRAVQIVHNQQDEKSLENTELMCSRIDMKLVKRVLKLPIISTSQLKWCQQKLDNIESIKDGKIIRAHTSFLFPS